MAMLYTLADKFLKGKDLEEVKEAVAMTRIGQMIFDDGVVRGREEGKKSCDRTYVNAYSEVAGRKSVG